MEKPSFSPGFWQAAEKVVFSSNLLADPGLMLILAPLISRLGQARLLYNPRRYRSGLR
jgi:hypothetical protein